MRRYHSQVFVTISGVLITAFALAACDPFNTQFEPTEEASMYQAAALRAAPTTVRTLKVMTWNVKFGGGRLDFFFDCHGDRSLMTEAEVRRHLKALATKIKQVDPDIVFLQEVDVRSKRSSYVDMMQALLDDTHLNYGAYASQWKADFVPSDGIGRVDSGNGLLSRWPIQDATRIALPLVDEYSGIKRYFYLKRNLLSARIDVPGPGAYTQKSTLEDVRSITSPLRGPAAKLRARTAAQEEAAIEAAASAAQPRRCNIFSTHGMGYGILNSPPGVVLRATKRAPGGPEAGNGALARVAERSRGSPAMKNVTSAMEKVMDIHVRG